MDEITEHHAHFCDYEVVKRVCELFQHTGEPGPQLAHRVMHELENSKDIVRLEDANGNRRYTTEKMWRLEARMLRQVDRLKQASGAQVDSTRVNRVLKRNKVLSDEQCEAVNRLLTGRSSIRLLDGVAGAGKSFALKTVRGGFEAAGYRVLGGAIAGAAKEELAEKTEIESRTIASYLYHLNKSPLERLKDRVQHDLRMLLRAALGKSTYLPKQVKLNSKTVLIIDEAGMLDTASLERLLHHVERAGATVIFCGDDKQLPPILAGGPMPRIRREVGPDSKASLTENRRQRDPADRQAVLDVRLGNVEAAISNYAARGRVIVGEDRQETAEKLISHWSRAGGARSPHEHMIFTQTRAEAKALNEMAQRERINKRRVTGRRVKFGQSSFYPGDRVLFHKPLRKYGIENGYRATVQNVDPIRKLLQLRLDRKPSLAARERGLSQDVTLPLWGLNEEDISLGYAATTHKLQGQTVDHGYVLFGRMTAQEMSHTQLTRAKHTTHLFVDELHAGEGFQDLIRSMKRSQAKNLAHDLTRIHSTEESMSQVSHQQRQENRL